MDRLIYTAASGMSDSMFRQGAIASNLANAQTIGFRAETFDSTPITLKSDDSLEARTMVSTAVMGADMSAGAIVATGRDLDLAMEGDAMLAVQAPDVDGRTLLTGRRLRRGRLVRARIVARLGYDVAATTAD